jgi:hypothetical protein
MDFEKRMRDKKAAIGCGQVDARRRSLIGVGAQLPKGTNVGEFAIDCARFIVNGSVLRCGVSAGSPALLVKTLPEPAGAASRRAR